MLAAWICRERISRVRLIVCSAKITPSTTNAPSTKVSAEFMVSRFIKCGESSGLAAEVHCLFCAKKIDFAPPLALLSGGFYRAVAKEEPIELMGNVMQVLPGTMFRVAL